MYSMNSCMHRVEGKLRRNRHAGPLSSQRFMAWSVSLCSGHNTTYNRSNPEVGTVPQLVQSENKRWNK